MLDFQITAPRHTISISLRNRDVSLQRLINPLSVNVAIGGILQMGVIFLKIICSYRLDSYFTLLIQFRIRTFVILNSPGKVESTLIISKSRDILYDYTCQNCEWNFFQMLHILLYILVYLYFPHPAMSNLFKF